MKQDGESGAGAPVETIPIGLSDGSVVKVDLAALVERLRALFEECVKSGMKDVVSLVRSAKADTTFLVRAANGSRRAPENVETCNLRGLRRVQWDWFCEYMKSHGGETVNAVAQKAIAANPGLDGFRPGATLAHYAYCHPSWWRGKEADCE